MLPKYALFFSTHPYQNFNFNFHLCPQASHAPCQQPAGSCHQTQTGNGHQPAADGPARPCLQIISVYFMSFSIMFKGQKDQT